MDNKICCLRLLNKIYGNLNFKIIDKNNLSIFYPYDFDKLNNEQYKCAAHEASYIINSMISLINNEIVYSTDINFDISSLNKFDFKDSILIFKLLADVIYNDEPINLISYNKNIEYNFSSNKKVLNLITYFVKELKNKTFYELRHLLKFIYKDKYSKLPIISIDNINNIEHILAFKINNYNLFIKDNNILPIEYFKLLANFIEDIERLNFKCQKEINSINK